MTRFSLRRVTTFVSSFSFAALAASAVTASPADAQGYFGRNKVQYETFDWRIVKSEHFDNFFYPAESLLVNDAGRMAERWFARHSDTFRHAFDRKSLIFYADQPDFQQTNVITETLEEGTGGVTEPMHTRVIMPFTGIYANNDHVLGHELVHVFQYNIAEGAGGLQRLNALPLWLIEGMAEYFSVGRNDPLTAMWMRDAVMRDKFPTINQLTTDPRFFPYRYGQALWAYVGGRWGDRSVVEVYRTSLRLGWDQALIRVLGENSDSLSKDWAAATKATYLPTAQTRTHPDSVGKVVVPLKRSSDYNISPSLSPDGKLVAFFSSRDLFGIDLYLADAQTGKIVKKLASPSSDRHFDAISFVNSAGDWSPDGQHFAFIAYANGDNQIAMLNTRSTEIEHRFKLGDIGSVSSLAWSPNGKALLLSGQKGGQSDLYLLDLATEKITQLTNDRYADEQPTWSPDGQSIAFVTDRGTTDFSIMKWGQLHLALMDVTTQNIRTVATFQRGRSINPQFAPDGRSLYFVSDQDGIPDIYRYDLATAQSFRVTKVATGISGITSDSPALSVARGSGRMAFTVFKNQGFGIFAFEPGQIGTPESGMTQGDAASELPPVAPSSLVSRYLADPVDGLPSGNEFQVAPYHSSFSLDAIGQPSLGASLGGPFGGGVVGGVSALWGDQLGDRQIFGALQANGTVKDIGGAVQYYNLRKRWNWGVGAEHMPYLTGGALYQDTTVTFNGQPQAGYNLYYILQRIYLDQASFYSQYPFSSTRRFEFSVSATHQAYNQEIVEYTAVGQQVVAQNHSSGSAYPSLTFASPSLALVGDNSFSAYTSPVAGERYRLAYSPLIGSLNMQTVTADYRKYLFFKPFTLAFRGLHYGRYGKNAEDSRLFPLLLGDEQFVRGYGYASITGNSQVECLASSGSQTAASCPVLDRLIGSRILVANTEFRIPLFGSPEFGLIHTSFLPIEVSPFFDAGVAYTSDQAPDFRLTRQGGAPSASCLASASSPTVLATRSSFIQCADRIPVFSTGLSFRANVLGYVIVEAYLAHPFQRPTKNWVWGFQLAPGW